MSIRNFDALFTPRSIALVGASNRKGSVGSVLARNLLGAGFSGPVMTVNPHEVAIRSTLNYRTIDTLPIAPDLAVVATPAATVPAVIGELAGRGCRAAVEEIPRNRLSLLSWWESRDMRPLRSSAP